MQPGKAEGKAKIKMTYIISPIQRLFGGWDIRLEREGTPLGGVKKRFVLCSKCESYSAE